MEQYSSFTGPEGSQKDIGSAKIVVLPVPYDKTSTWIKGADKGPFAILEASPQLEMYDIETDTEPCDQGIYTHPPMVLSDVPEDMVREVEMKVKELLDADKFVVTLGGEHSVSVGPIRAHSFRYNDFCVLNLDAHTDLRDEYEGSRYNHACTMARAQEVAPIVHAGIRSVSREEKDKVDMDKVFLARDIASSSTWIQDIINRLSDNVYVTIDLDAFDPAYMPSTGTPQPGGFNWYQVTALLKKVTENRNVVGFDVVELCPNETNKAPDILAAKLIYKFLGYIGAKKLK
ncbi:MAG: agmatinase [Candidatus Tantalella remota]|nr:agmatinase [Candidatus Tantalella remota]